MSSYIKYRPDIDGIRAIAVIIVVIFHINDRWLPGGFLGVDLFFVISGFLITSIIRRQLLQEQFSFFQFYARRIKRILPLFFVVLLCTTIVASILLLPEDYDRFWRSARYAMQFRANRAFLGDDYFDTSVEEKPLLHLWSLAIEEQFYFIWPLLLVVTYFLLRNYKSRQHILYGLALAGIIASIIMLLCSVQSRPEDSYFLLRNRAAELLIGCMVALSPFTLPSGIKRVLGLVGITILLLSVFLYRPVITIPGFYILIPTIAVMFCIQDDQSSWYKSLLSSKPLRWIGLLSFSIYMWHWPILAFMRYIAQSSDLSIHQILLALFLTGALSVITYFYVENPIRRLKWGIVKSVLLLYLLPFALISGINFIYTHYYQKNPPQFFEMRKGCFDQITDQCSVGAIGSSEHYLLVGDSHAMHLSEMLDFIGKIEDIDITIISAGGCRVAFTANIDVERHPACEEVNDYLRNHWQQYDAVMFSLYTYLHLDSEAVDSHYLDQLIATVKEIAQYRPVIFFLDIPIKGYNPRRYLKHLALGIADRTIATRITSKHTTANDKIDQALRDIPNVYVIELAPYVTDATISSPNQTLYFDHHHLSPEGSALIGELFLQQNRLKQILIDMEN